jgi:hypothetical protein
MNTILRIGLLFVLLVVQFAWAQTSDPQALLIQANAQLTDGFYDEAEETLERLTTEFAGQRWDAEARMHKAYLLHAVRGSHAEAEAMLQSIRDDFPLTEVGLRAGSELLDFNLRKGQYDSQSLEFEEYLSQVRQMIEEAGGFPLGGPRHGIARSIPFLTEDEQVNILYQLYMNAASSLSNAAIIGGFSPESPDQEAKRRVFFWRLKTYEFLPEMLNYERHRGLARDARKILGVPYQAPTETAPPVVSNQIPVPNSTINGFQPEISFSITSGTIFDRRLDLQRIVVKLDGIEIEEKTVRCDVNLDNTTDPFIIFHISFIPKHELATGLHRVEVMAGELGDSQTRTSYPWEFNIHSDGGHGTLTLPTTADSTLTQKHPHQNEGANPLLTLEKIQGKASRCAVAFDLANENINGLAKATLVLSIDPASHVTGWGNGETVSAQALSADWVEGNGKSFGFKKQDVVAGSGSGTTWFSPIDDNISNGSANSASSWNGAAQATLPATAPPVIVTNHTSGTLEFDVTADVLNGADSWLILKDQENRGSQLSFFSKESGEDLSPKLVLDFGDQVADNTSSSNSLFSRLGFGSHNLKLKAEPRGSELPSLREVLQQNPSVAIAGESFIGLASGPNPVLSHASQTAYRMWLTEGLG